jgi:hypothetical protein
MLNNYNAVWTEAQQKAIVEIAEILDITLEKAGEYARELIASR